MNLIIWRYKIRYLNCRLRVEVWRNIWSSDRIELTKGNSDDKFDQFKRCERNQINLIIPGCKGCRWCRNKTDWRIVSVQSGKILQSLDKWRVQLCWRWQFQSLKDSQCHTNWFHVWRDRSHRIPNRCPKSCELSTRWNEWHKCWDYKSNLRPYEFN